jgi:aspartyl-tRNA synthetase
MSEPNYNESIVIPLLQGKFRELTNSNLILEANLLIERATSCGIPIKSIQSYVDAFKHGALPHAGGGIGLERVVMLYLGLKNLRFSGLGLNIL